MFPFLRSTYNYDMNEAGNEDAIHCLDETLTQQSFKDECDINVLMERYTLTGEIPPDLRAPQYADFTNVTDYHSAMNAIAIAHEAFDAMPARVRERFNNDPEQFVVFCEDPANLPEITKLGLTKLTQGEQDERRLDHERTNRALEARKNRQPKLDTEPSTTHRDQETPRRATQPDTE